MKRSLVLLALAALLPATCAIAADDVTSPWSMQFSGTAQHFQQPTDGVHHWNQKNWGVGLQYTVAESWPGWSRGYTVGTMKDSFGAGGAYAGILELREFPITPAFKTQAGVGLFGFYRTFSWNGPYQVVAAPLPMVHVEHRSTGLGLNVLMAPRINFGSHGGELPAFVFFQASKTF